MSKPVVNAPCAKCGSPIQAYAVGISKRTDVHKPDGSSVAVFGPEIEWFHNSCAPVVTVNRDPPKPIGESYITCAHGHKWSGPCTICGRTGKPLTL